MIYGEELKLENRETKKTQKEILEAIYSDKRKGFRLKKDNAGEPRNFLFAFVI